MNMLNNIEKEILINNVKLKENDISVYIHWPFCISKCPYCDFNSHNYYDIDIEEWKKSYINEINYFSNILKGKNIKTIFFGGGTPSLMPISIVDSIISTLSNISNFSNNIEITLEANPTSSEADKFKSFKNSGINRLSLGIQSFNDDSLKILGRNHSSSEAIKTIEMTKAIFNNFSFDLIYARHKQNLKEWELELDFAITLAAQHISLYQLTIEKGTKYYKLFKDKKLDLPNSDLSGDMYEYTNYILSKNFFERYEISNYAKSGFESIHNMNYWQYGNYLGIGAGAHSRIIDSQNNVYAIMMTHLPTNWIKKIRENNNSIQDFTKLNNKEIIQEIIMMGLRTKKGLDKSRFLDITGKNFEQIVSRDFLNSLIDNKYLFLQDNRYSLSEDGLNIHNYILNKLLN